MRRALRHGRTNRSGRQRLIVTTSRMLIARFFEKLAEVAAEHLWNLASRPGRIRWQNPLPGPELISKTSEQTQSAIAIDIPPLLGLLFA